MSQNQENQVEVTPVDQAQAALDAAKAAYEEAVKAQREAKQEAERAARELERDEAAKKFAARFNAITDAVADILVKAGHTVELKESWANKHANTIATVNGVGVTFEVEYKLERISSWRSRTTSELVVIAGDYNSKSRFPQKKDGSHSFSKIADKLVDTANARKAEAKREDEKKVLQAKALSELGVLAAVVGKEASWNNLYLGTSTTEALGNGRLRITLTVETAERAAAVLKAAGLIS